MAKLLIVTAIEIVYKYISNLKYIYRVEILLIWVIVFQSVINSVFYILFWAVDFIEEKNKLSSDI